MSIDLISLAKFNIHLLCCVSILGKVCYVCHIFMRVKGIASELIGGKQNLAGVFEWSFETKDYPRHWRTYPRRVRFTLQIYGADGIPQRISLVIVCDII